MTPFDWLAVVVVLFSVVSGAIKGLTKTVVSSSALLVGLVMALVFYDDIGWALQALGVTSPVAYGLGVLAPVALSGIGGGLLVRQLHKRFRKTPLATLDRLGGGALGAGRAWLILSVMYLVLTAFPVQPAFVLNARVTPLIKPGARLITSLGKADLKARFEQGIAELRRMKSAALKSSKPAGPAPPNVARGPVSNPPEPSQNRYPTHHR